MFANPGPYIAKSGGDTDTEEKGDGGSESGGDGTGSHGRQTAFLDLTGDPSSGDSSHEEPRPKKAGRARKAPNFIQARPTQWDPTQQRARPANQDCLADEKAACASLAGLPGMWRKLPIDVQLATRSGVAYPASMKLLGRESENSAHALFIRDRFTAQA
ncbi:uncharacterized protein IUM83_08423 [Phytophthora cinnamomi]|uniref:uncharacterized protein n=1 Tax=Phytophthora cinnamomi TaxID=4785 RepID=UPI003559C7E9|nr:hypothetical protein IUM83_08423 [Phytophthora cinnamomi]